MGKHAEWRKEAKKHRRKRLRQAKARERDATEEAERKRRESSPGYIKWAEEQQKLEEYRELEEERLNEEENRKWLAAEEEGKKKWEFLSRKLANAREERARQQALIKAEWEAERKRLREIEEKAQKEIEERAENERLIKQEIDDYIENGGQLPDPLIGSIETNPHKELCPFFKKTATCRFGDGCSRNHVRPKVSRCLLFRNFYSHISLNQSETEHGSDTLEYDTKEIYDHFKEFFFDVVPEIEKFGRVKWFRVCCNREQHLRGNVYAEYTHCREAMKAYRSLYGRWYGGKQLNAEFCVIDSWKSAICGLFFKKCCPKGSGCNFLHIFRNPCELYSYIEDDRYRQKSASQRSHKENNFESSSRSWRWSESPERIILNNGIDKAKSQERNREYKRKRRRSRSRSQPRKHLESRRSSRSRSRSSKREQRKSKSRKRRRSRS